MKKNTLIVIAISCISFQGLAQHAKKTGSPFSFRSINLVGMTEGDEGTAFQLQTINGAQYKGWFAGLGVGLDYYGTRSVPLFLDLRKDILNRKNTPFVYANAGVNYVWQTTSEKNIYSKSSFDSKLYYDFGIGYKAGIGRNNALLLSLGYSEKDILEKMSSYVWPVAIYTSAVYVKPTEDRYSYTLRRLSLKFGWEF
jgi:hypothetical protein